MRSTLEVKKSDLLTKASALATSREGAAGPPPEAAEDLLSAYYRHVAAEDVCSRGVTDIYGALASHFKVAEARPQGRANVRVHTPTVSDYGWSASGHSVIEIVTDDMPFLVDSVTMSLAGLNHNVHIVVHPLFDVRRDLTGNLVSVAVPEDLVDDGQMGSRPDGEGGVVGRESWMHIEIDRVGPDEHAAIEDALRLVLRDVRDAVEDWPRMRAALSGIVEELETSPPAIPEDEVRSGIELLRWLSADHFAFVGYRQYQLKSKGKSLVLAPVAGTGLGVMRADEDANATSALPPAVAARARDKDLLVLSKANSKSTVHRAAYLDYVGIKTFDKSGEVSGEHRFLGLFTAAAYTESVTRIPMVREKVAQVISGMGLDVSTHAGKSLVNILENYPRDEIFQMNLADLASASAAIMVTRERRQLRLFTRTDTYGRYVSCLVYLPRDRYNTTVRERLATILKRALEGDSIEYTARVNEAFMAQLHFVVRPAQGGHIPDFDVSDLEQRLADAARSWTDDLVMAVTMDYGEERGSQLVRRYGESFPEAYKEDFPARTGSVDLGRLEAIPGDTGIDLSLYEQVDTGRAEARLKIYRIGPALSLSEVLPMISSMGVEVVDERPYQLENLSRPSTIYEFGLRFAQGIAEGAREDFQDALRAIWDGRNQIDGFNALVLHVGITWRQAMLLRAYAKYMKQGNTPYSTDYLIQALRNNPDITRLLVDLFHARFEPGAPGDDPDRTKRQDSIQGQITAALDEVASLDEDRILRSYLAHVRGTLRTNYYQTDADGKSHPYLSIKLDSAGLPDLPAPRPRFEIFVFSPRVEGVHLRFGYVARGGLRWSDRRDDYRTEILGLVKAQMVKNTVIVPVGAKGGFFCKQLPDASDREAWLAEGIACYRTFICGLLDITDNLVDGDAVPPRDVVRYDGDDAYLVVAADKGTASFSDIANEVSQQYGFWLGDAFASGGSEGYDHKAMGITARGAWVSVQRHFRERGIDCQTEDFTAVGVGDMSGDVFGNGMLRSEHTKLVAAFDHRDIFLDPNPDPAVSFAERTRLFNLPRSSWQDYDRKLISKGGGVYSRTLKAIPITNEVREALGLDPDVKRMTPQELNRAILLAPVDLFWNGGIGTYVKASSESNSDAGDKANDAIRVNGRDLRAKCCAEGGNLGFTQLGRVEYALGGGRINTDFIDNSAGVDTSDHEVNIKILLDRLVRDGDLTGKQRSKLLVDMTKEVGTLVLRDNYEQNLALANAVEHAVQLLHVHEDWMRKLEADGVIDRELEGLPSREEIRHRIERGEGLSVPELAVLMAWTKIVLAEELLASDLPDDPFLHTDLFVYFPTKMQHAYRKEMIEHPLKREIIVTQVVNDLVNGAGMTFWPRLAGETGASAAELTNANFVAREIFGSLALREDLKAYDNKLDAGLQTRLRIEMRTLVERASRWLVNNRRPPLDSEAVAEFFTIPVQRLMTQLPELMGPAELEAYTRKRDELIELGAPEELASRVAVLHPAYALLGVTETAKREDLDPVTVAKVHFGIGERLGLSALIQRILELPRNDRWETMARAAMRDDLHGVQTHLTQQVLQATNPEATPADRIAAWEQDQGPLVARCSETIAEICDDERIDLARVSVGLRVVRGLLS